MAKKGGIMSTKKLELYKCSICGNLVQVLLAGEGELVCCGEPMKLMTPQNSEADEQLTEKHTPIIYADEVVTKVSVEEHPMVNTHYIMFLQTISNDKDEVCTKFLYPGSEAVMRVEGENKNISARSYCNIHGLYVSEQDCGCGTCQIK